MAQDKVTIKIPKVLYEHLGALIEGSSFGWVTEFIVYILRDVAYEGNAHKSEFSSDEIGRIKDKLKQLGYL